MNREWVEGIEDIVDPALFDWMQEEYEEDLINVEFPVTIQQLEELCAKVRLTVEEETQKAITEHARQLQDRYLLERADINRRHREETHKRVKQLSVEMLTVVDTYETIRPSTVEKLSEKIMKALDAI